MFACFPCPLAKSTPPILPDLASASYGWHFSIWLAELLFRRPRPSTFVHRLARGEEFAQWYSAARPKFRCWAEHHLTKTQSSPPSVSTSLLGETWSHISCFWTKISVSVRLTLWVRNCPVSCSVLAPGFLSPSASPMLQPGVSALQIINHPRIRGCCAGRMVGDEYSRLLAVARVALRGRLMSHSSQQTLLQTESVGAFFLYAEIHIMVFLTASPQSLRACDMRQKGVWAGWGSNPGLSLNA
ncbi:hypothetical protein B0T14DRAFT_207123 [Immersiella caudata]|uniref:Uncharacterized protein n=1 Tax=Immersiella caudata TaxID=314043 RepID=A0AA39WPY2_9PEZI|nr:hypothetical protein B0T14DRAFT_207123 [Immersiella caudata]